MTNYSAYRIFKVPQDSYDTLPEISVPQSLPLQYSSPDRQTLFIGTLAYSQATSLMTSRISSIENFPFK